MEIESVRIVMLISVLGISSIFDIKTRKVPDILWMVSGGMGAILYLWDYSSVTPYHVITILTSAFAGIAIWRWKIAGLADAFAVIAMAVILPVHYEFIMMPIMILVMAFFIVMFSAMLYNILLNLSEMIRTKNWIFSEFKTESKLKKAFTFLSIHRKRKYEKFVISAENYSKDNDCKSFVIFTSRNKIKMNKNQIQQQSNVKKYVQNVPPLITFMFGVAVFLLLPEILNILFS